MGQGLSKLPVISLIIMLLPCFFKSTYPTQLVNIDEYFIMDGRSEMQIFASLDTIPAT